MEDNSLRQYDKIIADADYWSTQFKYFRIQSMSAHCGYREDSHFGKSNVQLVRTSSKGDFKKCGNYSHHAGCKSFLATQAPSSN